MIDGYNSDKYVKICYNCIQIRFTDRHDTLMSVI